MHGVSMPLPVSVGVRVLRCAHGPPRPRHEQHRGLVVQRLGQGGQQLQRGHGGQRVQQAAQEQLGAGV